MKVNKAKVSSDLGKNGKGEKKGAGWKLAPYRHI